MLLPIHIAARSLAGSCSSLLPAHVGEQTRGNGAAIRRIDWQIGAADFGMISSARAPRTVQLGARFVF